MPNVKAAATQYNEELLLGVNGASVVLVRTAQAQ
jgi:hypothetical protein